MSKTIFDPFQMDFISALIVNLPNRYKVVYEFNKDHRLSLDVFGCPGFLGFRHKIAHIIFNEEHCTELHFVDASVVQKDIINNCLKASKLIVLPY